LIGALIVTHGKLAHELLSAAQRIEANVVGIEAVPLESSKLRLTMQGEGPAEVLPFRE